MPCDFCKNLYEAIDLEPLTGYLVICADCQSKAKRAEEIEIMRSRGEI